MSSVVQLVQWYCDSVVTLAPYIRGCCAAKYFWSKAGLPLLLIYSDVYVALTVTGCVSQGARHEAAAGNVGEMQEGRPTSCSDQAAAAPVDGGVDDIAAMMGGMHARDKAARDAQV